MKSKKGKVYLVGAGPGDPGLITVRGMEILKEADTVLYDDLIPKELLQKTKPTAELILAAKRPKGHAVLQSHINRLMLEKVNQGKVIVRLKGGDPYVFGRGGEEIIYLTKRRVRVEEIPGVTSAIAVPASAGIPVTHRNFASSLAIITGHKKKKAGKKSEAVDVPDADTLVYLMGVSNLEKIVEAIRVKKVSVHTPCALIEKGTTANQKIVSGTLKNIVKKSRQYSIRPPAIFIVGQVVGLRKKIRQAGNQGRTKVRNF